MAKDPKPQKNKRGLFERFTDWYEEKGGLIGALAIPFASKISDNNKTEKSFSDKIGDFAAKHLGDGSWYMKNNGLPGLLGKSSKELLETSAELVYTLPPVITKQCFSFLQLFAYFLLSVMAIPLKIGGELNKNLLGLVATAGYSVLGEKDPAAKAKSLVDFDTNYLPGIISEPLVNKLREIAESENQKRKNIEDPKEVTAVENHLENFSSSPKKPTASQLRLQQQQKQS